MRARTQRLALVAFAAVTAIAFGALALTGDDGPLPRPEVAVIDPALPDPFRYRESARGRFEDRAAAGHAHVIYARSPGGVIATAGRVLAFRPQIEAAAATTGADPDMLEAIVFLESAGRPEVRAGESLESAAGLTQILAETATSLLGMKVDLPRSRRLTRRIARAERRGDSAVAERLRAARRIADERFDPAKALAGTVAYLKIARERLGRDDLAIAAYHMGIGNLEGVLGAFGAGTTVPPSYARLFFETTPAAHPLAHRRLSGLGDDSATYLWRIMAARAIMRAYRIDRDALTRRADLQLEKASAEEVLHPRDRTPIFDGPDELEDAYRDGDLLAFPNAPAALGLRRDGRMGELADRLEREPALYRGLRPGAYALAAYLARMVRENGGGRAPLRVTSTVRDREYQELLRAANGEATGDYSLHTTGWAIDIARSYSGRAQARAFQFALDRLQALNLIAWVREPGAIHLTVSGEASRLLPLLRDP